MDIGSTIAPNSDQLDAVDLIAGPRTFTVERVSKGDAEQPVNIHLAEFPRPWRPGKSMRRVLVACWGADAATYVGRRLTLWCDPTVIFGGAAVGGVRITRMSHLNKPRAIPLLVSRGKSAMYKVELLADTEPQVEEARTAVVYRTEAQSKKIFETAREAGISNDELKPFIAGVIGREIESSKTLTKDEARQVIDALEAMWANEPPPEGGEPA